MRFKTVGDPIHARHLLSGFSIHCLTQTPPNMHLNVSFVNKLAVAMSVNPI